jgi:transcription initiation factor TFIID subunit 13
VNQLLYAHGDVEEPLPETTRVLDEILTEFVQGVSFEAVRAANCTGRQKVKYEDFEFALRKNPRYLGKVQEVFEKKAEIDAARKIVNDEEEILKQEAKAEKRERKAAERAERQGQRKAAIKAAKAGSAAAASGAGARAGGFGGDGAQDDLRAVGEEEELGEGDDDVDADGDADIDMGLQ